MLSDMGESLDWVTSVTSENKWKSMKIRFGPGFYILIGAHPDAAQVILRSGEYYIIICIIYIYIYI